MSTERKPTWQDIFTEEEIVEIKAMVKRALEDSKKCEMRKLSPEQKAKSDLMWELHRQQEIIRIKGELAELKVLHRDEIFTIRRRHESTHYKWWQHALDERHAARIRYYNERTNREQMLIELTIPNIYARYK